MAKLVKPFKKLIGKAKGPSPKLPSYTSKPISKVNPFVKYLLIGALVLLVAFTIVYVYNIHQMSNKLEKFTDTTNKRKLEVIYIYKESCFHCKEFSKTWSEVSAKINNNPKLNQDFTIVIDSWEISNPKIPVQYSSEVDAFPTVLVIVDGTTVSKITGNLPEDNVISLVHSSANKA